MNRIRFICKVVAFFATTLVMGQSATINQKATLKGVLAQPPYTPYENTRNDRNIVVGNATRGNYGAGSIVVEAYDRGSYYEWQITFNEGRTIRTGAFYQYFTLPNSVEEPTDMREVATQPDKVIHYNHGSNFTDAGAIKQHWKHSPSHSDWTRQITYDLSGDDLRYVDNIRSRTSAIYIRQAHVGFTEHRYTFTTRKKAGRENEPLYFTAGWSPPTRIGKKINKIWVSYDPQFRPKTVDIPCMTGVHNTQQLTDTEKREIENLMRNHNRAKFPGVSYVYQVYDDGKFEVRQRTGPNTSRLAQSVEGEDMVYQLPIPRTDIRVQQGETMNIGDAIEPEVLFRMGPGIQYRNLRRNGVAVNSINTNTIGSATYTVDVVYPDNIKACNPAQHTITFTVVVEDPRPVWSREEDQYVVFRLEPVTQATIPDIHATDNGTIASFGVASSPYILNDGHPARIEGQGTNRASLIFDRGKYVAANAPADFTMTYNANDNLGQRTEHPYVVHFVVKNQTEKYDAKPSATPLSVALRTSLTADHARQAVQIGLHNNPDIKDRTHYLSGVEAGKEITYSWASIPQTTSSGTKNGVVKVTYPDGSEDRVNVRVTVTAMNEQYNPTPKNLRVLYGERIPLDNFVQGLPAGVVREYTLSQALNTLPPSSSDRQVEYSRNLTVTYTDGTQDVVPVKATVVMLPKVPATTYILQGTPEATAKTQIATAIRNANNQNEWSLGGNTNPAIQGTINTNTPVSNATANAVIENHALPNSSVADIRTSATYDVLATSAINGVTYRKPNNSSVIIRANTTAPYTIVNKPNKTDNNAVVVPVNGNVTDAAILSKIGNRQGWTARITGKPNTSTVSTGNTVTVELTHPNLPEHKETITITVDVTDTSAPTFTESIPDLYFFQNTPGEYRVPVEDKEGIESINLGRIRNGVFASTTIRGISTSVENGVPKIKVNANVVGEWTDLGIRASDGTNTVDTRPNVFAIRSVNPVGSTLPTKNYGVEITETEVLNGASLQKGTITTAENDMPFTKEIVSVNGRQYNGNNLPTSGQNNRVRVRYTNNQNGQTKEVDVIVNYQTQAQHFAPTGKTVRFLQGEDISDNAHDFVNFPNSADVPEGTRYVWKTMPDVNPTYGANEGRKETTGVVEVQYPDGSKEEVNVKADVVRTMPQNTKAYILQGVTEEEARQKIIAVTNRPFAWRSGDIDVEDIDTSIPLEDEEAEVLIENRFTTPNDILTGESLLGAGYAKNAGVVSLTTLIGIPYSIVNKPVKTDENAIEVNTGTTITDNLILNKIGNREGWEVVSITGKPTNTNTPSENTVMVVLRHPNLPNENQTFTIPLNIVDRENPVVPEVPNLYLFREKALDFPVAVTDNVALASVSLDRNLNGFGISTAFENGQAKIKAINDALSSSRVPAGGRFSNINLLATDTSGNVGRTSRPFGIFAVDVNADPIEKKLGQTVTANEVLTAAFLDKGTLTIPNENNLFTKEIVSVNGQPYNNNLPTRGDNTVTVRFRNTVTGQTKEVDVPVNFRKPPFCVKPANTNGLGEKTNFGITDLGRAGETPDAWPMLRKGGWIALESNDKGFVITRTTENQITNPQEGMLIYDTANHCLKLYDGTKWSCFSEPSCPTEPNN